jgi:2-polyprenyl-6-methoxyphenol hydroxylase-like FAD-dependent oxidoreductase
MAIETKDLPVLVSGGGIGGLAAALALVRQGFKVQVFEQAPEIGEIGAGIQLGPNAFHAFDALGVGDKARARAVYTDYMVMHDASTKPWSARSRPAKPSASASATPTP